MASTCHRSAICQYDTSECVFGLQKHNVTTIYSGALHSFWACLNLDRKQMSGVFWGRLLQTSNCCLRFGKGLIIPIWFWQDFPQISVSVTRQKPGYAWLRLLRWTRFAPFLLKMVTNMNSYKSELHTVTDCESTLLRLSCAFQNADLWLIISSGRGVKVAHLRGPKVF